MDNKFNERNEGNMDVTNKLLLEMVRNQKENSKKLFKVFISTIIGYTILLVAMVIGFFVYESQFETLNGEYEYTYEQSVDGENSEINNVTGNVYKDNAIHNGK